MCVFSAVRQLCCSTCELQSVGSDHVPKQSVGTARGETYRPPLAAQTSAPRCCCRGSSLYSGCSLATGASCAPQQQRQQQERRVLNGGGRIEAGRQPAAGRPVPVSPHHGRCHHRAVSAGSAVCVRGGDRGYRFVPTRRRFTAVSCLGVSCMWYLRCRKYTAVL